MSLSYSRVSLDVSKVNKISTPGIKTAYTEVLQKACTELLQKIFQKNTF